MLQPPCNYEVSYRPASKEICRKHKPQSLTLKCWLYIYIYSHSFRPNFAIFSAIKGLSTHEEERGHATPHMPVETAKCWWLLKIEPNTWAGGKGSCAVCVDLQAVRALEFFGELYSLAKGFWPIFEWVWAGFRVLFLVTTMQHFAVSTGICGVACPLPASRVDKPLVQCNFYSTSLPYYNSQERLHNNDVTAIIATA